MQKIIHQIWVGPHRIPQRESGFMHRMEQMHPDFQYCLWTDKNLPSMPTVIRELFDWRMNDKEYAFAADVLRPFIVSTYGGIYIDVDVEPRAGFHGIDIEGLDGICRHHCDEDLTITNDFFGFTKGIQLAEYITNTVRRPAYTFGPHWLGYTIRDYFNMKHTTDHNTMREVLKSVNMLYMTSNKEQAASLGVDAWENHFYHHALFSWSDENKKKFRTDDYA